MVTFSPSAIRHSSFFIRHSLLPPRPLCLSVYSAALAGGQSRRVALGRSLPQHPLRQRSQRRFSTGAPFHRPDSLRDRLPQNRVRIHLDWVSVSVDWTRSSSFSSPPLTPIPTRLAAGAHPCASLSWLSLLCPRLQRPRSRLQRVLHTYSSDHCCTYGHRLNYQTQPSPSLSLGLGPWTLGLCHAQRSFILHPSSFILHPSSPLPLAHPPPRRSFPRVGSVSLRPI